MVWEAGVGDSYLVAATLFQGCLVALVLAGGRLDAIRAAFALLIALSGFETAYFLAVGNAIAPVPPVVIRIADTAIVLTLPFLMAQFPSPFGGRRSWLFPGLWLALESAWIAWGALMLAAPAQGGGDALLGWALFQWSGFTAASALLALRLVPAWTRLRPGPLRGQTLLVGAGLGVGLVYVGVSGSTGLFQAPPWGPTRLVEMAGGVLVAWLSALAVVRLALVAAAGAGREAGAFAAVLSFGGVLALLELLYLGADLGEFASQSIRPLLLAVAMLRYDMFQVPPALRRVLVPPTAVFFTVILFFFLTALLSRSGFEAKALDPLASTLAVAALAGGAIAIRQPVAAVFRAAGVSDDRAQRLERYRLALEQARLDAHGQAAPAGMERLRERLGLTREEHDVLAALLEGHLVVPTSALAGAAPGSVVAGRYEVLRELGRGGFGRALLARDAGGDGVVVLKEALRPWEEGAAQRRASLEREGRVGKALVSPRVARVQGIVTDGYNTYLVRDYVPGETLAEMVRRQGPVEPRRAAALVLDVLEGLAALHAAGLLHLDLKPENVVVDPEGRAVLIDFGAARRAVPEVARTTRSGPGALAGTLAWMSPEQVLGKPLDARVDVFAAGALLHFLLAGRPHVAQEARAAYEVEDAVVRGPSEPLPASVPQGIREVVQVALARNPARRFPGAGAFRAALEEAAAPARRTTAAARP